MLEGLGTKILAAVGLAPVADPKVKSRAQISYPSFIKTTTASTAVLPLTDRRLLDKDLTTYRTGATRTAMADFIAASPDLSAAVFAYLRTAITSEYTAVACNLDGTFNPEATSLLQQLITRFDVLTDYSDGFSGISSMRSNSESLAKEILTYGAMSLELVLGKDRLPRRIQPISVTGIQFIEDSKNKILQPIQYIGGEKVDLDVPTFFYVSLDQSLLEAYSSSPLEPALKPVLFAEDFMNDLRRIVKRVIHPRMKVIIDEEKFRRTAPASAQQDEQAMNAFINDFVSSLESKINGLKPEDAIVYFDSLGISVEGNGESALANEYQILTGIIDGKMATGAKAMPAILGHSAASANIASTETMLFAKAASGAVQEKLNEIYSRAFTLAVRLFGFDVYVEFKYAPVDLRPESELEAFKQTRQSRVLELLSLGLMTDDQASLTLTGRLAPKGMKPLSGTLFKSKQDPANANPNGDTNGGSALNQQTTSDAPKQGRGQNNKANPQKAEDEAPEPRDTVVMPNISVTVDATRPVEGATIMKMSRDEDGNLTIEKVQNV
jgi:hypothetical protein